MYPSSGTVPKWNEPKSLAFFTTLETIRTEGSRCLSAAGDSW